MHYDMLDLMFLQQEARRRASKVGVTVQFSKNVSAPCTDGKVIYYPLKDTSTPDYFDDLRAAIIHEPLHITRPDGINIREGVTNKQLLNLHNILEDEIMEREHCKNFYGDAYALDNFLERVVERINKQIQWDMIEGDHLRLAVAMAVSLTYRQTWTPTVREAHRSLMTPLLASPNAADLYNKVEKSGFIESLATVTLPADVFDKAKELYTLLYDKEPDPEESGSEQEQEQEEIEAPYTVKWSEIMGMRGDHDDRVKAGGHIEYDSWSDDWSMCGDADMRILDLSERQKPHAYHPTFSRRKNEIRRLILGTTRDSWQTERASGKIHNRNLHRIAMPMVGDGAWNTRIFKKHKDNHNINTCVQLLVDMSGSMGTDRKNKIAINSAVAMNELFGTGLKIPTEVLGFSGGYRKAEAHVYKTFNQARVCPEYLVERLWMGYNKAIGGNTDAEAIVWASRRLLSRKEDRKIMIVLSDGEPSDAVHGDAAGGLLKVVKAVRGKGVHLYGIGIKSDTVKMFYGDHSKVIEDLSQFEDALIDTIREQMEIKNV